VPDLFDDVASGSLAPVYVLISEHPLLLSRGLAALRDAAVPPATRGFNYDVFEGRGASAGPIVGAAETLPMMAKLRMVVIRDLAAMAGGELAQLVPYLEKPNPSTVLVGVAAKVDKRLKFFAVAKKKRFLHQLDPPRAIGPWIRKEAAARGARMSPRACDRMADVVGKDLSRIVLAIDQLALCAGDREIDADDVDELIADTRERSVFELTDAIGEGNRQRALAAVASLCEQRQSAIGVVVMLARHMRQLAKCQVAMAERQPRSALPGIVGAPPFVIDKLMSQARRYDAAGLGAALGKLHDADRGLKGMDWSVRTLGRDLGERVLLERLVSDLIELGSAGSGTRGRSTAGNRR
jgi:DNA polymerase-3 subunit delta